MKTNLTVLFGLFVLTTTVFAARPPSAVRAPGEDYRDKIIQHSYESFPVFGYTGDPDHTGGATAVETAKELSKINLNTVEVWPADKDFKAHFASIRDERLSILDPSFPRRSTWLYPDDGCFARAELSSVRTQAMRLPAPSKIFVFGNLNVATANSPEGSVSWWYHVVIGYRVQNVVYVVDPAIDPSGPLKLEVWLDKMGDRNQMKVAFCSAGAFEPYSQCRGAESMTLEEAADSQSNFLSVEWHRLTQLGRDPNKELGDSPPWNIKEALRIFLN